MRELLIPIGLVLFGILLLASEALIPSAGILGVFAAGSLLAGVCMSFYYGGLTIGTGFLVVTGGVVALVIRKMIQWWPRSTIGRMMLVEPAKPDELLPDRSKFLDLVGAVGTTQSLMLPGGFVEIDSKRYDAVSETAIDPDQWVRVTGVADGRILEVRQISPEEAQREKTQPNPKSDPLELPMKDVLDDPFEDALG